MSHSQDKLPYADDLHNSGVGLLPSLQHSRGDLPQLNSSRDHESNENVMAAVNNSN